MSWKGEFSFNELLQYKCHYISDFRKLVHQPISVSLENTSLSEEMDKLLDYNERKDAKEDEEKEEAVARQTNYKGVAVAPYVTLTRTFLEMTPTVTDIATNLSIEPGFNSIIIVNYYVHYRY